MGLRRLRERPADALISSGELLAPAPSRPEPRLSPDQVQRMLQVAERLSVRTPTLPVAWQAAGPVPARAFTWAARSADVRIAETADGGFELTLQSRDEQAPVTLTGCQPQLAELYATARAGCVEQAAYAAHVLDLLIAELAA